jgi:hypothetical protein
MPRLLLLPAVLALTALAGPSNPAHELEGTYAIAGTNPDGSAYAGALTVAPHGDAYHLAWDAGSAYDGIGLVDGDAMASSYGPPECGVAAYRIGAGGALVGTWTDFGLDGVGTETATKR